MGKTMVKPYPLAIEDSYESHGPYIDDRNCDFP